MPGIVPDHGDVALGVYRDLRQGLAAAHFVRFVTRGALAAVAAAIERDRPGPGDGKFATFVFPAQLLGAALAAPDGARGRDHVPRRRKPCDEAALAGRIPAIGPLHAARHRGEIQQGGDVRVVRSPVRFLVHGVCEPDRFLHCKSMGREI